MYYDKRKQQQLINSLILYFQNMTFLRLLVILFIKTRLLPSVRVVLQHCVDVSRSVKTCTCTDELHYSFVIICNCVHTKTYDIYDTRYTQYLCNILVLVISKEKDAKIQTYNRSNLGRFQNDPVEICSISLFARFLQKEFFYDIHFNAGQYIKNQSKQVPCQLVLIVTTDEFQPFFCRPA